MAHTSLTTMQNARTNDRMAVIDCRPRATVGTMKPTTLFTLCLMLACGHSDIPELDPVGDGDGSGGQGDVETSGIPLSGSGAVDGTDTGGTGEGSSGPVSGSDESTGGGSCDTSTGDGVQQCHESALGENDWIYSGCCSMSFGTCAGWCLDHELGQCLFVAIYDGASCGGDPIDAALCDEDPWDGAAVELSAVCACAFA